MSQILKKIERKVSDAQDARKMSDIATGSDQIRAEIAALANSFSGDKKFDLSSFSTAGLVTKLYGALEKITESLEEKESECESLEEELSKSNVMCSAANDMCDESSAKMARMHSDHEAKINSIRSEMITDMKIVGQLRADKAMIQAMLDAEKLMRVNTEGQLTVAHARIEKLLTSEVVAHAHIEKVLPGEVVEDIAPIPLISGFDVVKDGAGNTLRLVAIYKD